MLRDCHGGLYGKRPAEKSATVSRNGLAMEQHFRNQQIIIIVVFGIMLATVSVIIGLTGSDAD